MTAGQWVCLLFDTIEEMLTLRFEGLLLLQMWDITVPIMIGVMKIGESVVVRRPFHPDIIDPDLFVRLQVVVNDHSPGAHDSHLSDLSGLEPTALNSRKALLPER